MLILSSFLLGFALGLWAGRKQALHPDYFPALWTRVIAKVRK